MIIFDLDCLADDAACGDDKPFEAITRLIRDLSTHNVINIWSSRCDSTLERTRDYIGANLPFSFLWSLKMRPDGDDRPVDELFEDWLDQNSVDIYPPLTADKIGDGPLALLRKEPAQMVFSANPDVIKMFRRRGVFVFDCNQKRE